MTRDNNVMTRDIVVDTFKEICMQHSIELLDRALAQTNQTVLAEQIGVRHSALSNCKKIGHLSPLIAGGIAVFLNENVDRWMAVAAIESARKGKARTLLERHMRAAKTVEF